MIKLGSHVGMAGKDMFLASVKEAESYGANVLMLYTGAVSYTPLDVYKRQAVICLFVPALLYLAASVLVLNGKIRMDVVPLLKGGGTVSYTHLKNYLIESGVDEGHIIEMAFDLYDNIEYKDCLLYTSRCV